MKTINDLVDRLNAKFDYADFFIKSSYDQRAYYIDMKTFNDYGPVIEFDKQNKYWSIGTSLGLASNEVQREIMDFIYGTDKIHWFDEPEKKYNIIIGENVRGKLKTAYRKFLNSAYVCNAVEEDELKTDKFKFTESEIKELKSKVSEQSAKIIDLGKVEVKDD